MRMRMRMRMRMEMRIKLKFKLKFKIFKLNLANCSNFVDEKWFAEIFGYTLVTLANKLINTTNKEENQIIVNDIEKKI